MCTLPRCWYLQFLQCYSNDVMDTPLYGSPVRTYENNQYSMRMSHDVDCSDPKDLSSLGVVDLDLSITPDAFGLKAFDVAEPLTRMLPGQFANALRLMKPDVGTKLQGFHDIVIENLAATPTWRSRHLLPGDVTSLRQRWAKALFRTMRKRLMDMEQLRRDSHNQPEWEFHLPGYCSRCQERVATAIYKSTHDGTGTVLAVPGGMVHCLERLCE